MSKRNLRRLAAVGGVALALGAAAPAMALRLDTGALAGAVASVDTDELLGTTDGLDLQNVIDFGRDTIEFTNLLALGDVGALLGGLHVHVLNPLAGIVDAANLESVLPDCSLLAAVSSCNTGDTGSLIGGDVIGGDLIGGDLNVLNVLSGNADDGISVLAPVIAPVAAVVDAAVGPILGDSDGFGFLTNLLNVSAGANVFGLVGIL